VTEANAPGRPAVRISGVEERLVGRCLHKHRGSIGALLSPVLRRTVFSRNTQTATEGLKRLLESRPTTSV